MNGFRAEFDSPDLLDHLEASPLEAADQLEFGLVTMDRRSIVLWYNRHEAHHTGLDPETVVGTHFFEAIGPCMNNFMVAQRFEDEPDLDVTIDYVFTLRMSPTPVRLRLLARAGCERQYLAVRFP